MLTTPTIIAKIPSRIFISSLSESVLTCTVFYYSVVKLVTSPVVAPGFVKSQFVSITITLRLSIESILPGLSSPIS